MARPSTTGRFLFLLLVLCAVSGAFAGRTAHLRRPRRTRPHEFTGYHSFIQNEKEMTVEAMYNKQVDELAEMVSTVFMVHHGTNLQQFKSLNVSSVLLAAELGLQGFFMQVENYIKGTVGLVTNLPAELAGLPKNISDALAPGNQPDFKQLGNTTYLMEQYKELVAGLENPLAVQGGGSVFSYSPCFINFDPAGIAAYATGINIAPSLAVITPDGIKIAPQGLVIQPVLVTIFPVGVNVQPQGLNIGPALIAVTPGRVAINPQGATIASSLISVTAQSG